MIYKTVAAVTVALLTLVGCSVDDRRGTPPQRSAAIIDVDLSIDVVVNVDGSVSVFATSNLPEGTKLGSSLFAEGAFLAQDSQVLRGGKAEFGPFTDHGGPVAPGTYDVSVTMPIARLQPNEVRALIGEAGENLTGPLVSMHDITGDAVVEVREPLVIPDA